MNHRMRAAAPYNIIIFTYFSGWLILCESFPTPIHFQKFKSRTLFSASEDRERNSDEDYSTEMGTWNPFSLGVLKLGLTEPAWTSSLNYKKAKGIYQCAYCKTPLFSSVAKYDSGSGWPSFWKTLAADRVSLKKELGGRIECSCANCGGHLGKYMNMIQISDVFELSLYIHKYDHY